MYARLIIVARSDLIDSIERIRLLRFAIFCLFSCSALSGFLCLLDENALHTLTAYSDRIDWIDVAWIE